MKMYACMNCIIKRINKALPILKEGYIRKEEEQAVDNILKAAAFTYVAASLMSILNVWRWFALLRR